MYNAIINPAALPAPCTGAAAATPSCLTILTPSSQPSDSGSPPPSSTSLALALGLGLGLGIPLVAMAVVAMFLLSKRRRTQQIITPTSATAAAQKALPPAPWAESNHAGPSGAPLLAGPLMHASYHEAAGPSSALHYSANKVVPLSSPGQPHPLSPGGSSYPPLSPSAANNPEGSNAPRPWTFGSPAAPSPTMGVLGAPPSSKSGAMQLQQQQQQEALQMLAGATYASLGSSVRLASPLSGTTKSIGSTSDRPPPPWDRPAGRSALPPMPDSPRLPHQSSLNRPPVLGAAAATPGSSSISVRPALLGPYGTPSSALAPDIPLDRGGTAAPWTPVRGSGVASPRHDLSVTPSEVRMSSAFPAGTSMPSTPTTASKGLLGVRGSDDQGLQQHRLAAAYGPGVPQQAREGGANLEEPPSPSLSPR